MAAHTRNRRRRADGGGECGGGIGGGGEGRGLGGGGGGGGGDGCLCRLWRARRRGRRMRRRWRRRGWRSARRWRKGRMAWLRRQRWRRRRRREMGLHPQLHRPNLELLPLSVSGFVRAAVPHTVRSHVTTSRFRRRPARQGQGSWQGSCWCQACRNRGVGARVAACRPPSMPAELQCTARCSVPTGHWRAKSETLSSKEPIQWVHGRGSTSGRG